MEPSLTNYIVFFLLFIATVRFGITRSATLSGVVLSSSIVFMWAVITSAMFLGVWGALAQPYWGICATLLALSVFLIAPPRDETKGLPKESSVTIGTSILSLLLVLLCISVLWVTWVSEPTNIDDLYYHYAKVLHLGRSRGFTPSGLEVVDGYPQNGELLGLFLAVLFGTVRIADTVQILALPLYIASISLIALSQKMSRTTRSFISVLSCFVPAIWSLLITLHTDFLAVAFLLASIAVLLSHEQFDRGTRFMLLGAGLGLALGTKFVTVSWVVILCSWAILSRERPRRSAEWLLFATPLIASGAGTYLLNIVRYGNPLYPYTISLLSVTLPGRYHSLGGLWEEQMTEGVPGVVKIINSWFSPAAIGQSNHEHWYGGLGTLWPFLFLMITLATLIPGVRDRRFLALMGLGALLLVATPANFTARFTLFLVPFGALALGKVLEYLSASGRKLLGEALVSLAVLFSVHCAFQFLVLISTEFKNGLRVPTLTASCKRAARPQDLRVISNSHQEILEDAEEITVELGPDREERLWSFACLWAMAPKSKLSFGAPSLPKSVILRTSSFPGDDDGLKPIYKGPQISLLVMDE